MKIMDYAGQEAEIGHEFVIEAFGEEFLDKKLYFVCLLCDCTQKHSSLKTHLISTTHRMKFLTRNFSKTAKLIELRKEIREEKDLKKILDCICAEICSNNDQRKSLELNYAEYEDADGSFDKEVVDKAVKYDYSLEYVEKMNEVLQKVFKLTNEDLSLVNLYKEEEAKVESVQQIETETKLMQEATQDNSVADVETLNTTCNIIEPTKEVKKNFEPSEKDNSINKTQDNNVVETSENANSSSTDAQDAEDTSLKCAQSSWDEINKGLLKTTDSQKSLDEKRNDALISLYEERVKKEERELSVKYKKFMMHPWTYPQHEAEWSKFYIEKSYQISLLSRVMGLACNYLSAWDVYWIKRVKELKRQELEAFELQLREQLNIPQSPEKRDELSEISEDETEYETPKKRRKIEDYEPDVTATLSYHPSNPAIEANDSNTERVVLAYHIALSHFEQGKRLSPDELVQLVNEQFEAKEFQQATSGGDDLNDQDLLMLLKNFSNLSDHEQENYLSLLRCIEISDPLRFDKLKHKMKRCEMN